MKIKNQNFFIKSLYDISLPAITIMFGLQNLRILIPTIVYVYGDAMGASTVQLGLYAVIVFLISFLFASLSRLIGIKIILILTISGICFIRLLEQIFSSPFVDLFLSTLGTAIFVLFIPSYLIYMWNIKNSNKSNNSDYKNGEYIIGIFFGFALDTALSGAFKTYDINWHSDIISFFIILILTLVQFYLLFNLIKETGLFKKSMKIPRMEPSFLFSIPILGWGAFLFLQLLFFQNIGFETVISGLPQPIVLILITLGNIIAILFSSFILRNLCKRWLLISVIVGAILLILSIPLIKIGGIIAVILLFIGQLILASEFTFILKGLESRVTSNGSWRSTIFYGIGIMLFVAMIFVYYAGYDIKLPINNQIILPIPAGILLICIAISLFRLYKREDINLSNKEENNFTNERIKKNYLKEEKITNLIKIDSKNISLIAIILILIFLLLVNVIGWKKPKSLTGSGYPVRVMTYNLHQGFDVRGYLGMEALAKTIETGNADIVALQEVSRGWFIDGSVDMLTWLSQRLNMPYIYGPVGDPLFGNAILSKYPVLEYKNELLPKGDVPLQRGFLWVKIDLGNNEELFMIATHLHHVDEDNHVRKPQIEAIVDYWGNHDETVILGDMNAKPHYPETQIYYNSGLLDTFNEAGTGNGFTYSSDNPDKRIDYIWISPDLAASDFVIPESTASDHLGIAVTIDKK